MKITLTRAFGWLPLLLPLYVVRFSVGPLPTTLLEVGVLALAAWWFIDRREEGLRDVWKRSAAWHWPAAFWLLAGIVAMIVSPVHLQAIGLFRAYFLEPLLIFIIGFDLMRTPEQRNALWRSFSIVTLLLAAYAVVQLPTAWGIPSPWNVAWPARRATSLFPFPNALALFVTPIAALAAARVIRALDAMKQERARRIPDGVWMDIVVFIAGLIAILCAQSDGGLVALAAAVVVTMFLHRHSRRFAIELVIAGLLAIALIAPLRTHVMQVALLRDWSGMVRKVMWKETATMLMDRPVLGAGLSGYPTAILPYHHATWMEVFQYPHNIALNLWSETGLLGVAAFAFIIVIWIRQGHANAATVAVVTALLVHGLVDVPYFKNDLAIAFWLLALLTTIRDATSTK